MAVTLTQPLPDDEQPRRGPDGYSDLRSPRVIERAELSAIVTALGARVSHLTPTQQQHLLDQLRELDWWPATHDGDTACLGCDQPEGYCTWDCVTLRLGVR